MKDEGEPGNCKAGEKCRKKISANQLIYFNYFSMLVVYVTPFTFSMTYKNKGRMSQVFNTIKKKQFIKSCLSFCKIPFFLLQS